MIDTIKILWWQIKEYCIHYFKWSYNIGQKFGGKQIKGQVLVNKDLNNIDSEVYEYKNTDCNSK